MADNPTASETIVTPEPEPEPEVKSVIDPVEEFRKNKAKREYKRKEVKIIETHVPDEPKPVSVPAPVPAIDPESIARRTAEIVLSAMGSKVATESEEVEAKPKRGRPKKEVTTPPEPPATKSFGWC